MTPIIDLLHRIEAWQPSDLAERHALSDAIHELVPAPKVVQPLSYCTSLDAALSLSPAGADAWRRLSHKSMSVYSANPYNAKAQTRFDGHGATPAAQLTAAAIRARFAREIEAELLAIREAEKALP